MHQASDMHQALTMMDMTKLRRQRPLDQIYLQLKDIIYEVAPFLSPIFVGLFGWLSIKIIGWTLLEITGWTLLEISEEAIDKIIMWLGIPTINIYTIFVHVPKKLPEARRIRRIKRHIGMVNPPLSLREIKEKELELCPNSGSRFPSNGLCRLSKIECDRCGKELDISSDRIPDHLLSQVYFITQKGDILREKASPEYTAYLLRDIKDQHLPQRLRRPIWKGPSGV